MTHLVIGPLGLLASGGAVDAFARVLAFPAVSAVLVALGFLGLLLEFKTAGWGVGGSIGVVALSLFFWAHLTLGYAGWEAVLLVGVGLVLLALEIFVIPGFGISGTLGLLATGGGIFLALVGNLSQATTGTFLTAGGTLGGAVLLVVGGGAALIHWLPDSKHLAHMVLHDSVERQTRLPKDGYRAWQKDEAPSDGASLEGHTGTALTDLHPAGAASIDGRRVDVVTRGEYLDKGTAIEVIEDSGYRKVVQTARTQRSSS